MIYKSYKARVYVGPTSVEHYAAQAKANGFADVFAGTEHVWLTTEPIADTADRNALRQSIADRVYFTAYEREHGASMAAGWRDVELVREA